MSTLLVRILLAGTAMAPVASAASAQTYDWSGPYVGIHTGRDWSHSDWAPFSDPVNRVSGINIPASGSGAARGVVTVPPTSVAFPITSANDDRPMWGGHAGWAFQSGQLVFGIEGDIDAGHRLGGSDTATLVDTSGSSVGIQNQFTVGTAGAAIPIRDTTLESTSQIVINRVMDSRWSWSARARVGYAWDRWQLYATAGLAGADIKVTGTDTYYGGGAGARGCFNPNNTPCFTLTTLGAFINTNTGSASRHRIGWTAGGGLDVALGRRFSLGLEARHTDLGRAAFNIPSTLSQSGTYVALNVLNGAFVGGGGNPPTVSTVTPTGPVAQAIVNQTPIHFTDDQVALRLSMRFGGSGLTNPADGGMREAAGPYNWTGFYLGVHGGDNWRRADPDVFNTTIANPSGAFIPGRGIVIVPGTTRSGPDANLRSGREIWGAQAGYAHQFGDWVLGIEGDMDGPGKVGTATVSSLMPLTAISSAAVVTDSRTVESRWSWAALARIGFAWDRMQLYAAGGAAGARIRVSGRGVYDNPGGEAAFACIPNAPGVTLPGNACSPQTTNGPVVNTTTGSASRNRVGWAAGGGGEWALTDALSFGLDFRHTDLGRALYSPPTNGTINTGVYTAPAGATTGTVGGEVFLTPTAYRYTDNAVTFRVSLRFGR